MHKPIKRTRTAIRLLLACTVLGIVPFPGYAQTTWQTPPEPIASQLDTPINPRLWISPDNQWIVHADHPPLPSIAELAEPVVKVAGLRLNPLTREPAYAYRYRGLSLQRLGEETIHPVPLPAGARVGNLDWSFDSRYLAFTLTQPDGLELWVLDLEQNTTRRLTEPILNGTYGIPCDWLPADEGLICKVVPDQPPPPQPPSVPDGPRIEESLGQESPARTFADLLQNPHDEALFEYYLSSTLEHIALDGTRRSLTSPLLIDEATPSPDGQWILLETFHRPFSYQVLAASFPKRLTVLNRDGEVAYLVAELPLADSVPLKPGSVRPGRRWANWRSDRPSTLYWVEALDGGDARQEAELRDAVYQIDAPFANAPELLWQTEWRFGGFHWGTDTVALAYEIWEDTRRIRTWRIAPGQTDNAPLLLNEREWQDAYNNPGDPVTTPGDYGWHTLLLSDDDSSIFLNGYGASPEGVYPFLDRWNLSTMEKTRLWQAQDPYYERVMRLLDNTPHRLLIHRQSPSEPFNLFMQELDTSNVRALTQYEDPLPWYADVTRRVMRYEREDGIQLSATLYLPPDYELGVDEPLPTLVWVYPQEFESRETASQITRPENVFSRPYPASPEFLLTQGYALLINPSLPIIGEGDEEANDTYLEQLLLGAQAAVNYLTQNGISNPDRIAVGGESYGAFTTANLLAHSDLFCAGIAINGAYNRTLTPFGFQGESRHFWEAQDVYMEMSPFTYADTIDEPLLLIHGAEDNNPGTYPIQSERLYQALRGLGGTVRWVELPLEEHSYESREAIGHTLWEMNEWLKRCGDTP